MKVGLLPLLAGVVAGLFYACSSINCPIENTVAVNYSVYNNAAADGVLGDTLWVMTRRSDDSLTVLLNRFTGKSSFTLPISYSHPEDMLLLVVSDTANVWTVDTLWLKKDDIPHFESVDCSAHFFHRITAVRCTYEGIDSVTIENPLVNYDQSTTHLHIYFGGIRAH